MTEFASRFLNELTTEGVREPRVFVGAFGKHPGWDDHIDDIGLETQSLATLRRRLYGAGISSQIDSGAWSKLEPEKTVATFDHVLVWRRLDETILCVMWASTDGKGRALYPMSLCVHGVGLEPEWYASVAYPVLARAELECKNASSAAQVISIVTEVGVRLRQHVNDSLSPLYADALQTWRKQASRSGEELARLMHTLVGQFNPFAPGQVSAWASNEQGARSKQVRVPKWTGESVDADQYWIDFLATQLDPAVPLLAVSPRKLNWVDVIVGEPTSADFFCLRASEAALPCATDIPYVIEPSLSERRSEWVLPLSQGRSPENSLLTGVGAEASKTTARDWLARTRTASGGVLGRALVGAGDAKKRVLGWLGLR